MQASLEEIERGLGGLAAEAMATRLAEIVPGLDLSARFVLLHRLGFYHGSESASGKASDTATTARIRGALRGLFRDLGVRRLVDAPCGDCHWMGLAGFFGAEDYLGLDIVEEVVARNIVRYGSPGRRFAAADVRTADLPAADLLLCRDALIHLSDADALAALRNFARSGCRWLLATCFDAARGNRDILSGSFRPIALEAPPFGLPRPARRLADTDPSRDGLFPDRALALWPMSEVAAAVG